jgi:phosphoribosylanthranilate isomerase
MLVKICGLTLVEDAAFAAECGADLLGIVMSENSPRRATPDQARAILKANLPQPKYLVFGYDDAHYIENTFRALALPETRLQIMADHPEIDRLLKLALAEKTMPSISASKKINPDDIAPWEKHALVLFDSHRSPHPLAPSPKGKGETGVRSASGLSPERVAGGTGKTFNHENIAGIRRRYLLAGGLNADNVAEIIAAAHPPGVDVASGVESRPGIKDRIKLRRFIENAKGANG